MSTDPGATPVPQPRSDELRLASPDLEAGHEEASERPDLADPAGEQSPPDELPEVDAVPGDLTGLHDRAGDQQRYT